MSNISNSLNSLNSLQYELVIEHKNKLYARLYNPNNKQSKIMEYDIDEYVPPLYIPSNKQEPYTSFTTGEYLQKKSFNNIYEMMKFMKSYREANIKVYGNTNRAQYYISRNYPKPLECSHVFRTWFFDIETRAVNGFAQPSNPTEEISLIQIYDNFLNQFIVLSTKDTTNIPTSELGKVNFKVFADEVSMLNAFIALVQKLDPTVLVGFNSNFFDIPYLTNRIRDLGLDYNKLSPIGVITETEVETPEKISYVKFDWVGRYLLDYRELFQKYSYDKLPKYSLEVVATHVLGTGKVKHDEYLSLEQMYNMDFDTFLQYGVTDVELLVQMDEKLKMIDTAKMIAYTCGVNIYDVFGTLKQWSSYVYNEALKENKVLPLQQMFGNPNDIYVGGWTKSSPGTGRLEWVISYDFSSLYPSVTRAYNYGVDTLLKDKMSKQEAISLEINRLRYELSETT